MDPFQALVVNCQPYRETSALLTLLTADHGVVRGLAKGALRRGGAAPAALDPLAWIEGHLSLRAPDALGTLAQLNLHNGWPALRRAPQAWAFASLGIEVLWRIAAASPPEPALFNEGCAYLEHLEHAAGPGSLTILLLIRLLHWSGFPPQLGETPGEQSNGDYIHDFHANALALSTAAASSSAGAHGYRLPAAIVQALWPALVSAPPLDPAWTLPSAQGRTALRWLIRVWEDHLNQPLQSAPYLESMVFAKGFYS